MAAPLRTMSGGTGGTSILISANYNSKNSNLSKIVTKLKPSQVASWHIRTADPHMRDSFKDNFSRSTAPNGEPWANKKESTKNWQAFNSKYGVRPLLRRTYYLHRLVTTTRGEIERGGYAMRWGGNIKQVRYLVHQKGTNKAGRGRHTKIPQRKMIGFKVQDRIWLKEKFSQYLARKIGF